MASDLLALLDTLDGLHKAATDSTRFHATKRYDFGESAYALWPELSTALRTALTPTTDGEREVREALAKVDHTTSCGAVVRPGWACGLVKGHEGACGTYVYGVRCHEWREHLRTALALLATERAKAADAARERAAIVAWLRGPCNDPVHDDRWCPTCEARSDYADAIERGAHTKVTP